ncbi:MAG: hypothetical protein EXR62_18775 [Chloroflexi bacterium]|nr:hypothetical protein [Chloroflexota bacterium]
MSEMPNPKVRYVVIHSPGPLWQPGVAFREQPGVSEHVAHYRSLFEQGKLEMGGPFLLADAGGMMVPVAGMATEEMEAFAAADPAVLSGLLRFEIKPWYVAMRKADI